MSEMVLFLNIVTKERRNTFFFVITQKNGITVQNLALIFYENKVN